MTESTARRGIRWSVRTRILTAILAVSAVGLTVSGFTAYLVQHQRAIANADERLVARTAYARATITGEASSIAPGASVSDGAGPRVFTSTTFAVGSVLSHDPSGPHESSLGIIDGEPSREPGVPVAIDLNLYPGLISRAVAEAADGRTKIGTYLADGVWFRYVALPITVEPADSDVPAEEGIYLAVVDLDGTLHDLNDSFLTYAITAFVALVAIGFVGWFAAGRVLRPLRSLRSAAAGVAVGDLGRRIRVDSNDDVGELTETVNSMLDRIEGAVTGQRRLLDDVRHELKTPITIVRGHLEVLDIDNRDDVEATRALAIDELDRMARLVDDIESLAETQLARELVQTDAAALTEDVYQKASVIPGHDWVLAEVAIGTVVVDPNRITQAWLQLADNAAKYSAPGTTIELGSTVTPGFVEFWVDDAGPGIEPAAVDRIFERFGRVDTGRGIRGSGLGLPIVKAIAQAHGGRVSLSTSPSGSRFGLVVPTLDDTETQELEVTV